MTSGGERWQRYRQWRVTLIAKAIGTPATTSTDPYKNVNAVLLSQLDPVLAPQNAPIAPSTTMNTISVRSFRSSTLWLRISLRDVDGWIEPYCGHAASRNETGFRNRGK